jgi:hypothetical protein
MVAIYEVAGPIYVYTGAYSILSRILAAVVVLQYFLSSFLGVLGCDVGRANGGCRIGGGLLGWAEIQSI